jgi:hypothetical protein
MEVTMLQGQYQRSELRSLLERIANDHPTGRLLLRSGQKLATLFIAQNFIVDALVGTKKGIEAFDIVSEWENGDFRFSPGMVSQDPSINFPFEVLEGQKLIVAQASPRIIEAKVQTPQSDSKPSTAIEDNVGWRDPKPGAMTGELSTVDVINLIQVLCNTGQSGTLRIRPHDEAKIHIGNYNVLFATYQDLRGLQALTEIATWRKDEFRFETGVASSSVNIDLPLTTVLLKMSEAVDVRKLTDATGSSEMYFYSSPIPSGLQLDTLTLEIVNKADGVSFEELVQDTRSNNDAVALAIKNLLDYNLMRTESSPSTPKTLRFVQPFLKEEKGFLRAKPKLKLEELNDLELRVFDQINGGRTLWDIRINLGITRQEVWAAYHRLLDGGLIGSNAKAK